MTPICDILDALQQVRDARDKAIARAVAQTEREYLPRINLLQSQLSDAIRREQEARK